MSPHLTSRSASVYRKVSVETSVDQATPHQLVHMLYDGLLQAVGAARQALARGDVKTKCQQIVLAVRIIEEGLILGLNREEGGELAQNLHNLYRYCVLRLTQANARNDAAALDEVVHLIEPVAKSWRLIGSASATQALAA
jgi:flagellar secretion chaperone FliS